MVFFILFTEICCMAKFRLLTLEELQALEKDFIEFLVINGVTADEWEKLKKENVGKAEQIVILFSDVVFETIFRKVEYLEWRSPKEIRSFQCLPHKIVLVGLKAPEDSNADFTEQEFIQQAMRKPDSSFQVYTTEKEYAKEREIELFEMTKIGCTISDGKLFKAICLAFPE